MRVLITGSRDWDDSQVIWKAMDDALMHRLAFLDDAQEDHVIVHGGAPGADDISGRIADEWQIPAEVHPANWASCGSGCGPSHYRYRDGTAYCPRSGFIRNSHMVALGADICLAFIKNDSKGANMTADLAEKAGIPTFRFRINDDHSG